MAAAAQARPQSAPAESDIVEKARAAFSGIAKGMRDTVVEAGILATRADPALWAAGVAKWQASALARQLDLVAIEAEAKIAGGTDTKAASILRQASALAVVWREMCASALTVEADRIEALVQGWGHIQRYLVTSFTLAKLQLQQGLLERSKAEAEATLKWLRPLAAKSADADRRRLKAEAATRAAEAKIEETEAATRAAERRLAEARARNARIVEEDRKFKKRLKKARHNGRRWAREYDQRSRASGEAEAGWRP